MKVMMVLVTAVAFGLGSMGAALAADAIVNLDGLKSVGDSTLSQMHGKNITATNIVNNSPLFIVSGGGRNGSSNNGTASTAGGSANSTAGNGYSFPGMAFSFGGSANSTSSPGSASSSSH